MADPRTVQRLDRQSPDARGLYARLTAREHQAHTSGELHALERATIAASIERLAELLDMGEVSSTGGRGFLDLCERMKVALGRALVHDPPNLLLDEPTSGLDVMSTRAMRSLIRQLRAGGKCVLFIQPRHAGGQALMRRDRDCRARQGHRGHPEELCRRAGENDLEEAGSSAPP